MKFKEIIIEQSQIVPKIIMKPVFGGCDSGGGHFPLQRAVLLNWSGTSLLPPLPPPLIYELYKDYLGRKFAKAKKL